MCRKQRGCTELGDPAFWSHLAPLPPPEWARVSVRRLGDAIRAATRDDREAALSILTEIDSQRLRAWGAEHGQMSGRHRCNGARNGGEAALRAGRSISDSLRLRIHERDSYHCRYCGMEIIVRPAIKAFARYISGPAFTWGSTLESRHGAALLAVAQVDHLVPYNAGGTLSEDNLVTACWSCNYGKDGFTLEQLGLDDPRSRPPVVSDWDGLASSPSLLEQFAHAV